MKKAPNFTQDSVRRDLTSILYGLAYAMDTHVRQGGGSALLDQSDSEVWPDLDDFDLTPFQAAAGLPAIYRYAVHGEQEMEIDDDVESGNLGLLIALIDIANGSWLLQGAVEEAQDHFSGSSDAVGGLSEVVALAKARHQLDTEPSVDLPTLALLAKMDERSVRNAIHADGPAMLMAFRDDDGTLKAKQKEALLWLKGRRGFKETVYVGRLARRLLPQALQSHEIIPFVASQIETLYESNFPRHAAAQRIGWSEERVNALLTGQVDDIDLDDAPTIARMLRLDPKWFSAQMMRARFPEAMKELAPESVRAATGTLSPLDEKATTMDVVLTGAGIRNGYFDLERRYADRFFPADSFGSRGSGQRGTPVTLQHDLRAPPFETDIRVKSEALVSPRKRFSAYFTAHDAKPGDIVRIKRLGERNYALVFLNSGSNDAGHSS